MKQASTIALIAGLVAVIGGCTGPAGSAGSTGTTPAAVPTATQVTPTPTPVPTSTSAPSQTATATALASLPATPAGDDVAYATQSQAQRLDLYVPQQGIGPHPLIVVIHGGGWVTGDKRGDLVLSAVPWFLNLGYAVATINYRLADEAVFPAQLVDVKAAIRYLRANAQMLHVDPDQIVAIGESAGAHLALLLGTTAANSTFDDPALGNSGVSSAVQAIVDYYGPADLATSDEQRRLNAACTSDPDPNIALLLGASPSAAPDLAAAASPVTYLAGSKALPPFFITHGDADCVVPYQQSVEMYDAIEAVAPGRSALKIVAGSGHYLDFDFNSVKDSVTNFLTASIGR